MSYKDFPKSVRLNKVIFDITKFVFALLAGLVFEIFLVVLCLDIKIATLIAAYISYKINDMFYYSYIKILMDNTKICYCRKLNILYPIVSPMKHRNDLAYRFFHKLSLMRIN